MMRQWNREDILTVPNALSVVRLALIPLYLWLYCVKEHYAGAVLVLALSGVTDILDGFIARRFNMISDFGKILDPAADKLTQVALIVSLALRYSQIWVLLALFLVKELTMGVLGLLVMLRTKTVHGARWYGKMSTAVLEGSMGVLILFPMLPGWVANGLFALSAAALLFSFVQYVILDIRYLRQPGRAQDV